ncbi:MAG: flagellar export protein FliJ [Nitrospira sp.]|nr:flagellar export protein FliJ [Nitrospira sp.]
MSLESLRKVRARAQEAVMMELALLTQELTRMERQCETIEAQIQAEASDYQAQVERGLAVEAMWEWQGRLDSRRASLGKTHAAIQNLMKAWNAAQERLIEATQERKVLDRLAERRQRARDVEILRREQYATDEAAGRVWGASEKRSS